MLSLPHTCALFKITPMTLRRWCHRAGIVAHRDPVDNRCKYLDDRQLFTLSRQHNRIMVIDNVDTVMLDQIGALNKKFAELEQKLKS